MDLRETDRNLLCSSGIVSLIFCKHVSILGLTSSSPLKYFMQYATSFIYQERHSGFKVIFLLLHPSPTIVINFSILVLIYLANSVWGSRQNDPYLGSVSLILGIIKEVSNMLKPSNNVISSSVSPQSLSRIFSMTLTIPAEITLASLCSICR